MPPAPGSPNATKPPAGANTGSAICLVGTSETTSFNNYVNSCRTQADTQRANNFFSESVAKYKESFDHFRAQYDDLIVTGDSINSLMGLTGATADGVNRQIDALTKKKDLVKAEIEELRRRGESADKSFLEDIMHAQPKKEAAPSLQDAVLLLFWFGWAVLMATLIAVQFLTNGWRSGLFSSAIIALVTLCLFALLRQLA